MKTVRVRVLVAITDDGTYVAQGDGGITPKKLIKEMTENLHDYMTPPVEFCWLEADIPVPAKLRFPIVRAAVSARRKP